MWLEESGEYCVDSKDTPLFPVCQFDSAAIDVKLMASA